MSIITETQLQHMPGCRCSQYFDFEVDMFSEGRAFMVDDRHWEHTKRVPGTGLASAVHHALETAAKLADVPFLTIKESRWNADGEGIGPRLETRVCEMVEYALLMDLVTSLIEHTVQRMRVGACSTPTNPTGEQVAASLKMAIRAAGLTQKEVAERTNIPPRTLSRHLRGGHLTWDEIRAICRVTGRSAASVIDEATTLGSST